MNIMYLLKVHLGYQTNSESSVKQENMNKNKQQLFL